MPNTLKKQYGEAWTEGHWIGSGKGCCVNKIREPPGSTDRRQFFTSEETITFSQRPLLHDVVTNPTEHSFERSYIFHYKRNSPDFTELKFL
jgi:hypothetical protein